MEQETYKTIKCGDCRHFIRNGKCNFFGSAEGKSKDRAFDFAPFWVWSDCYSDKEQVRSDVTSACSTFTLLHTEKEHG